MHKDTTLNEVKKIMHTHLPAGFEIVLFGSWAKGTALETSDLDIGILGEKKVPDIALRKIRQEVERLRTLRKIDVVDFSLVSKNFKDAALKYAKSL